MQCRISNDESLPPIDELKKCWYLKVAFFWIMEDDFLLQRHGNVHKEHESNFVLSVNFFCSLWNIWTLKRITIDIRNSV